MVKSLRRHSFLGKGTTMSETEILTYENLLAQSNEGPIIKAIGKMQHKNGTLNTFFNFLIFNEHNLSDYHPKSFCIVEANRKSINETKVQLDRIESMIIKLSLSHAQGATAELQPSKITIEPKLSSSFPLADYDEIVNFFANEDNHDIAASHVLAVLRSSGVTHMAQWPKTIIPKLVTSNIRLAFNWGFKK
jgi:hypothetical protein